MAHLKPRSTTVVIYQGDDMDELADLRRRVQVAQRIAEEAAPTARLGDATESVTAAQNAYDAFVDQAAERALTVRLNAIGRRRFLDLMLDHPARMVDGVDEDGKPKQVVHEDDATYEVNASTFPMALLTFRDGDGVATIAEPEFKSSAAVREFLDDELSEGDFQQLWIGAYYLNRGPSGDPLGSRYSLSTSAT